ncbi:MAG: hypothetical protein JWN70_5429 [Planctomycetaceae bacterium]|nr:hypothetical protein [Planctomycetaceae bacterium]
MPHLSPVSELASLNRRQLLKCGAGAVGAYFLPRTSQAEQARRDAAPAKRAIFIFLQGGISQYESWDPKPEAPSAYRGEFQPIDTNVAGTRLSEHLPLLAQQAHRFNLIRSVYQPTADHINATHMLLTGYSLPGASIEGKNRNANPTLGAVVAKFREGTSLGLPGYVCVPHRDQFGHRLHYGSAAYLGSAYDPFDSGMLPELATGAFEIPANLSLHKELSTGRIDQRLDLLGRLDRMGISAKAGRAAGKEDPFLHNAYEMLSHGSAERAFDLNQEPVELRKRYGDHGMGQEAILARRLAEAGVPFTMVNFSLNQVKGQDWDTHVDNCGLLKRELLPPMDRAVSALLEDLDERGLLDTTLVCVVSEFGRTPRITPDGGRDHWPNVYSLMIAGGGLKRGQVLGASTRAGDEPLDRPVHIYDVLATIYHQMGVPAGEVLRDLQGRPLPVLASGTPIPELLA